MDNKDNQKMCCVSGHGCVKKAVATALILLALFLLAKTVSEIKSYGYIGREVPAQTTITVNGKGEVVAIPDTASVSFSVTGLKMNVSDAQKDATKLGNSAVDFLKKSGIEESDIKTTYYSISPRYDYVKSDVNIYGRQVLSGYEVSQGFEVKIKEIANAGKILSGLGGLGVQNVSG
ncbi:MAG: SIMPL domain-containing protein, partial [Candidatus Paceibacterota bacterium]